MAYDDFILNIENERLPVCRKELAELQSGDVQIFLKRTGGPFIEETQEMILERQQNISILEKIVARYCDER
jgi:lantibiotic modifying enzyme